LLRLALPKPAINKMTGEKKKVFVALSGGVDSSTAAALLLQAGFDCVGVFMITSDRGLHTQADTQNVAEKLGIELYVLDLRSDFEQILAYFCSEYKKGRTPNPCVVCNRNIKFGKLWDFAKTNGAQLFATGHYARVFERSGQAGLYAGADFKKDQSYALSMIDRDVLPHIVLPLGNYTKDQTRKMAGEFGLGTELKAESQEICFIPNDDYVGTLEHRCPEIVREGDIVDSSGRVLGKHNGVHRFTIGQRRGLHVAMGKPYYVVKIDAETNTVTLGPREEVMHRKLLATGVNWLIDGPFSPFRACVKIRYNDKGAPAAVTPQADNIIVEFDRPVSAITPGQLAVFYVQEGQDCRVAGGAWIDNAFD
jgi:tRNA-specific 2-thiouridylase